MIIDAMASSTKANAMDIFPQRLSDAMVFSAC
jgi:hypothetical protein